MKLDKIEHSLIKNDELLLLINSVNIIIVTNAYGEKYISFTKTKQSKRMSKHLFNKDNYQ